MQDIIHLHPPSVTVDCRPLQPIFTVKITNKFSARWDFPQIDIQPPRNGFPCGVSGHTIFEVSTQNRTPTSLNASAKKTRMKRFVPMLLASFCPLLASGDALLTTVWIHQLPRYRSIPSLVALWVWSFWWSVQTVPPQSSSSWKFCRGFICRGWCRISFYGISLQVDSP